MCITGKMKEALRCLNLDGSGLRELEAGKPRKVVGRVGDLAWPASNLPGVSKSCHPRRHPDRTSPCLVVQKRLLLSSEASWHPGSVNGEVGILSVNHASPCLLSLSYISQRARGDQSLDCYSIRGGIRRFPQTREAFGTYFGLPLRLGQPLPLAGWRGARGRSESGKHKASSCPFPSRAPLSHPELIFLQSLIPIELWFSTGGEFDPQGTCVNVPRHFRWSQLGVLLASSRKRSGMLLNIL